MATTSLWHIEGRLKDLIDYVENPEKTAAKTPELQDLYNVFSYVQRPEATQEGEYITAINCLKETALRQKKAGVTEQITVLRKQLKLNKAIEVRSAQIQEKTNLLYANEYRAKEEQQRKKSQRRERDAR